MKNLIKISFFAILLAIFSFGCTKQLDPDQATGKDVRVADLAVSDVFTYSSDETDDAKAAFSDTIEFTKEVVQNDDGTYTTTLTFDSTFVFNDGVIRSGQIIITWQPRWRLDSSKQTTVIFNKFSRDGNILTGNLKFQMISGKPSETENAIFKIVEDNMELTLSTGEKTTWEGTRTIEWLSGFFTTRERNDDVRKANFSKEGINRDGTAYTATGTDLIFDNQCEGNSEIITAGTISIVKENITTIFNFGDGECDNSYTVTQGRITITLNQ